MSAAQAPSEPPPSYETATGSSSAPEPGIHRVSTDGPGNRLERNGIPPDRRRSMEDEMRELPPGWVRSFDPQEGHQFFVDTRANPPRSIWVHPYDDEQFLSTLSPEERKRHTRMHRTMTLQDLAAEDSDHEELPPRPGKAAAGAGSSADSQPKGLSKFSRKLKDKITGQTHDEREQQRIHRAEQERQAYLAHLRARQALMKAIQTGEPQFLCKDQQGRDVYIEPPRGAFAPRGAYGYNPYAQGPNMNPNVRIVRPMGPYDRRGGYGYGGGAGLPIAAGFLGGAMLGGALF
jgi:hypothetical protein